MADCGFSAFGQMWVMRKAPDGPPTRRSGSLGAAVAQLLYTQEVSGSNPLASTVAEAEVADAPGCGPGGSGFESRQSPQERSKNG